MSDVGRASARPSALVLTELQLGLRGGKPCNRNAIRRAGDVIEPAGSEEADGVRIASMFPADADLEILVGAPAAFRPQLDQLSHAALIDRLERIPGQDLFLDVLGEERARVVARIAERHLRQIVGAE